MAGPRGVRSVARRTLPSRIRDAAVGRALHLPLGSRDFAVRRSVPVTMRDGIDLLTDLYEPSGDDRGTLLIRTPYGRAGLITDLTARLYAAHGYRVVNQSCRGTAGSGGRFEPFVREVDDGADTVAWLREQPWFGGTFALVGASYLGYTAWAVMVEPPAELATAVIAVTAHDNHWVVHGAGAFALEQILSLLDGFSALHRGTAGGLLRAAGTAGRLRRAMNQLPLIAAQRTVLGGTSMPYAEWLTATEPDDPVWRPMRLGTALDRVDVPVLLQGGWQDRFTEQQLDEYVLLRRRGVPVALTIGEWTHVETITKGWGLLTRETFDWLDEHLPGGGRPTGVRRAAAGTMPGGEAVRLQRSGTGDWVGLSDWPPPVVPVVLHLHPDGRLDAEPPVPPCSPSRFDYDPADPTPAVGGRVVNPALGGRRDNRRLEARADVLTFTGPVLTDPLELIGRPVVRLAHSTDNPHADLFVRLCEVHADGRSINLSDGFKRLAPANPDALVTIELEHLAHRFAAGSRVRLQISGGAHPRFARNLGTAEDPATGTTLAGSRRTIDHGPDGSRLELPRHEDPPSVVE